MAWSAAVMAFVTAVGWFAAFVLVHILGWRAGHGHARWLLATYLTSVIGTLATVAGLVSWSAPRAILAMLLALMTSACLFVLYVPAVYTVLTSLSVQTIVMVRRRGGSLSAGELHARFAWLRLPDQALA